MEFEQWKIWREEQAESRLFYKKIQSTTNLGLAIFTLNVVVVAAAAFCLLIL